MTTDLVTLTRKVDLVLAKLEEMNREQQPSMTQADFARLMKVTPRTVCRWVKTKKLRVVKGRVPSSETHKFLS